MKNRLVMGAALQATLQVAAVILRLPTPGLMAAGAFNTSEVVSIPKMIGSSCACRESKCLEMRRYWKQVDGADSAQGERRRGLGGDGWVFTDVFLVYPPWWWNSKRAPGIRAVGRVGVEMGCYFIIMKYWVYSIGERLGEMNTKAAGGCRTGRDRWFSLWPRLTHRHRSKCDAPQMRGRGRHKLGPGYKQMTGVIPFGTCRWVLFSQLVRF